MKILWIVNTIFPYPAKQIGLKEDCFGGWLNGLADEIKKEEHIELAIATVYTGNEIKKFNDGKVTYYLMPGAPVFRYKKELNVYSKKILDDFQPDILHIHGTEYAHALSFLNEVEHNIKKVISIQGLISCIAKVYLANIPYKEIIENITLRDVLKQDNLFQQRNKFIKRGRWEKEIINRCDYIIGRTEWDYANTKVINEKIRYYCLYETVRKSFYTNKWDINDIEKYSIYLSQAGYPIKGLHILIEALSIIKKKYPNVKLYISGNDIINKSNIRCKLKRTGYGKYIDKLIEKHNLRENVIFTGELSEERVLERLLKTHVVVVPSIIENESNSLTEAHLLGMPTIAAFSGGMTDRIIHKETGFLYPYTDYAMCAEYILKYFNDDNLAIEHGNKARKIALDRNNPTKNKEKLFSIYKEILKDTI